MNVKKKKKKISSAIPLLLVFVDFLGGGMAVVESRLSTVVLFIK